MYPILVAFLVVTGIALLAGTLLAVISHLFAVKEDPKYTQIRECLPNVNCGACGYKGCDDYANALVAGEAKPNLCIPGTKTVADKISELLGIEAEPFKDMVAFVACDGNCEATTKKAYYEGVQTCSAASMLYGGPNSCRYGCLGLGDCASVCPADAICTIDGIAHIDSSRCLGCAMCVQTCPKNIISLVPQNASVVVMCSSKDKGADSRKACKNSCIGCKKCEKTCSQGAITVTENLAVIDYDKCTGCGECVSVCCTGCLKKVFFPDLSDTI